MGDVGGGALRVSGGVAVTLRLSNSQSMQGQVVTAHSVHCKVPAESCNGRVTGLGASLSSPVSPVLGFASLSLQPPANSELQADLWGGLSPGILSTGASSQTAPYLMARSSLVFKCQHHWQVNPTVRFSGAFTVGPSSDWAFVSPMSHLLQHLKAEPVSPL